MLINASKEFSKGRPKNFLTDQNIARISDVYHRWQEAGGLSKIIATDEALRNDSNLSPSRYVAGNDKEDVLPLEEAVVLLNEAEEERQQVDNDLKQILAKLGLGGSSNG
jgi:type I restriction enzyme M protein